MLNLLSRALSETAWFSFHCMFLFVLKPSTRTVRCLLEICILYHGNWRPFECKTLRKLCHALLHAMVSKLSADSYPPHYPGFVQPIFVRWITIHWIADLSAV